MASADAIRDLLDQRILVLDGAWGTMLQGAGLQPEDYRGDRFSGHPRDLTGDPDLLNLTRPDVVLGIHRRYLAAGADITSTNTFPPRSVPPVAPTRIRPDACDRRAVARLADTPIRGRVPPWRIPPAARRPVPGGVVIDADVITISRVERV